jgi:hypothetical protein
MTNFDKWMDEYSRQLPIAVAKYPGDYAYPVSECPTVIGRMRAAFERGSFNHSGQAIKATCKALGLKYTRKAIVEFLGVK